MSGGEEALQFCGYPVGLAAVVRGGVPGAAQHYAPGVRQDPAEAVERGGEVAVACQKPNVVSEPSQVYFACARDTRPIPWVFSLLTIDDNANFTDSSNSRKGLEPIQPAQAGDIAWSLNLHHPYNPANPVDSLEVAARAINNIIGGTR